MKNRVNQLLKDKLLLVMMVLGLLTIVAAAGTVRIRKGDMGSEQNPYVEAPETQGILAEDVPQNRTDVSENGETNAQPAGSSDAEYSFDNKISGNNGDSYGAAGENSLTAGSSQGDAQFMTLQFNSAERLGWPVRGNVILDYSMETTTYFPTLDQYKCNPALIIQGEVSTAVAAPADAYVASIGTNEEIGNYVVLELGNEYTAICGQLKDIQVAEDQYVAGGSVLGYVAEPTKYYSVEGDNVYFELQHKGQPVDALDYLE